MKCVLPGVVPSLILFVTNKPGPFVALFLIVTEADNGLLLFLVKAFFWGEVSMDKYRLLLEYLLSRPT